MISLFPSLIDGDFLGLPIFLFLPVLSSYYTIIPHFFGIYRKFCTGSKMIVNKTAHKDWQTTVPSNFMRS